MEDNYRGLLTQQERWRIWEESLDKPLGSYAKMRDQAEYEKHCQRYRCFGR